MANSKKQAALDALDQARRFREASRAVGDFVFRNIETLKPAERDRLLGLELTLLNLAMDLVTQAVDAALAAGQNDLRELNAATEKATKAIKRIESAKKAIEITTAFIALAAAIPGGDWSAIGKAGKALVDAAQ